jgi:hydrogenase/urease accessory protein HupE
LLIASPPVAAHETGAGKVDVTFDEAGRYFIEVRVDAETTLRRLELAQRQRLPPPQSPSELQRRLEDKRQRLLEAMTVYFDDQPVVATLEVEIVDPAALLAGQAESPGEEATSEDLFRQLAATAGNEAILRFGGDIPGGAKRFALRYALPRAAYTLVLRDARDDRVVTQNVDVEATSESFELAGRAQSALAVAWQYLVLGFRHILPLGADHVFFVLGIFLLSTRVRPVLFQVTAFTVAHTLTLGLSIYGILSLPSTVVEPLIALSIAYVAIENVLTTKLHSWRVAVVFGFGLLHGLGFAGALRDLGLPRSQFLTALVGFNLGVELGQLAVIAVAFTLFASWARHRPWYRRRIVVPASLAIAAVGLLWTVERLLA